MRCGRSLEQCCGSGDGEEKDFSNIQKIKLMDNEEEVYLWFLYLFRWRCYWLRLEILEEVQDGGQIMSLVFDMFNVNVFEIFQ